MKNNKADSAVIKADFHMNRAKLQIIERITFLWATCRGDECNKMNGANELEVVFL